MGFGNKANDPSAVTRPAGHADCNSDVLAGFAVARLGLGADDGSLLWGVGFSLFNALLWMSGIKDPSK